MTPEIRYKIALASSEHTTGSFVSAVVNHDVDFSASKAHRLKKNFNVDIPLAIAIAKVLKTDPSYLLFGIHQLDLSEDEAFIVSKLRAGNNEVLEAILTIISNLKV